MICTGTGMLILARRSKVPNTPRICSNRSPTSRPFFSPASVMSKKFGVRTSVHPGSEANMNEGRSRNRAMSNRRYMEADCSALLAGACEDQRHVVWLFRRSDPILHRRQHQLGDARQRKVEILTNGLQQPVLA